MTESTRKNIVMYNINADLKLARESLAEKDKEVAHLFLNAGITKLRFAKELKLIDTEVFEKYYREFNHIRDTEIYGVKKED